MRMKDKLEILLSCMHQTDEIIKRSNIRCNVTVVNQCDKDDKRTIPIDGKDDGCVANWIDSTKRGLSRSRNMALQSASFDFCLISDDDEVFVDGVDTIIEKAFKDNPKSDVLIFKLNNWEAKCPSCTKNVGYTAYMSSASLSGLEEYKVSKGTYYLKTSYDMQSQLQRMRLYLLYVDIVQ